MNLVSERLVYDGQDHYLFDRDGHVLSDNPGLTCIFGCNCTLVGYKRQSTHYKNLIMCVYSVEWSKFRGDPIPGTHLFEGGCVSSNSLRDATIVRIAVDKTCGVVSILSTSYWVSDKNDIPDWRKGLFQHYCTLSDEEG